MHRVCYDGRVQAKAEPLKHRGADNNPANRFEAIHREPDEEWKPADEGSLRTQFLKDESQTIIAKNDSPDIGFEASLNPYRGCEHGCIYCYARPTHEFLGFSAGLDFESKIMVKERAPELVRAALTAPKWRPQVIVMSGVTDCYQPIESKLQLTRRCLAVLAEFRNPVAIITKSALIGRDADLLGELAKHRAAAACLSITTLNPELRKILEPRAAPPAARLAAIKTLTEAGIPTSVNIAPVIPGLNDHEMPAILKAAAEAGATSAGFTLLRLPYAVAPLFEKWLTTHFPDRKEKVLNTLRSMRDGKLYQSQWGTRMRGEGLFAEQMQTLFEVARRKAGIKNDPGELSVTSFRRPGPAQLSLF